MEKKPIRQIGLEVIRRLENQEELQALSEFQQKLRYFKKRFEDEEFRIAVVGEFSSGKSTFINALIGQDVLQHAKKETTATITRLVNVSPQDTRCGKGNVKLHSGEIVTLNDFTSLKEYTTTASDKLNVAAEVEQAELFVPLMKSTRPMVVVDTPGLNGIEGGHREQTMALVQQAHACIYLISRRGISESDTLLLRQLAAIQKNFIFIQNFIDDLNAAEGETLLQKLDEQKRILQEKVLYDAPDVKFSLCGISALLALAAQDQSIDRLYAGVNEPKLTEEMRRQMYQRSNFQQLRDLLAETFQEKNLAEIQYGDSVRALLDWIKQMMSQVSLHSEQVSEAYELSRDRMAIKKLDEQAERTLKAQKDNEKKLTNFVLSQGWELRKKIKAEIKEVLSATEQYIDENITGYGGGQLPQDAIHNLEEYQKNSLAPLMKNELNRRFRVVQKNCVGEIDGIRSWLLEKIEKSHGVKAELELKLDQFDKSENVDVKLKAMEDKEAQLKREIIELETNHTIECDISTKKLESLQEEKIKAQEDLKKKALDYRIAHDDTEIKKRQLGERPKIEQKPVEVEVERRGLFGIVADIVCDPKMETQYKDDNTKLREWEKKLGEINDLTSKEVEAKEKLEAARRQVDKLKNESGWAEEKLERLQENYDRMSKELKARLEHIQLEKTKAASEYLDLCKKNLMRQVENCLDEDGETAQRMNEIMENLISSMETECVEKGVKGLRDAMAEKLRLINMAKAEHRTELENEVEQLEQCKSQLCEMKQWMEDQLA